MCHVLSCANKDIIKIQVQTAINVKIAHWAHEFSTNALGEMLSIICKSGLSKNNNIINDQSQIV